MTKRTLEVLQILHDHPDIGAERLSHLLWPDNDMHRKVKNCGNGARTGIGFLCAGSYMARLIKKGLVWRSFPGGNGYQLSADGRKVLREYKGFQK